MTKLTNEVVHISVTMWARAKWRTVQSSPLIVNQSTIVASAQQLHLQQSVSPQQFHLQNMTSSLLSLLQELSKQLELMKFQRLCLCMVWPGNDHCLLEHLYTHQQHPHNRKQLLLLDKTNSWYDACSPCFHTIYPLSTMCMCSCAKCSSSSSINIGTCSNVHEPLWTHERGNSAPLDFTSR